MQANEIFLAKFPFGDKAGMKLRPVLTLTGAVGPFSEVLVAYISSVVPAQSLATDVVLDPSMPQYGCTNLKVVSVLRLHKLATIHTSSLARQLGVLPSSELPVVRAKLRSLLAL